MEMSPVCLTRGVDMEGEGSPIVLSLLVRVVAHAVGHSGEKLFPLTVRRE